MKKLLKKQDGFTLVELLAVIVILAIISAIAIPAVGHIISSSRQKAEANDALQIIDAAKLYIADGNNTATSGKVTITSDKLKTYLNGTHSTFTNVTVTLGSNGDGDTYAITGHVDPEQHATGEDTEAALLNFLGESSSSSTSTSGNNG
jgi:type IV pilus assembly protein PilA